MKHIIRLLCLGIITLLSHVVISQEYHLDRILKSRPGIKMNVPVKSNIDLESYSKTYDFTFKKSIQNWDIIYITPENLSDLIQNEIIQEFQVRYEAPQILNDTARAFVKVDSVYDGASPLTQSYKGSGTIIGVIDTGIDFNHPDFQNANGSTRVLHYWDQTLIDTNSLFNPVHASTFGYGQVWDSTDINSGNCLSMDNNLHGTHVTGTAASNALADGTEMGMAPEANIIMVESDFNHPNWSLSVAEACDYIFHIADSLDMPASINISLGSYLGSHDGNDIATEYMESLLDEKAGRLITCAVGNSGLSEKYHVHGNVDADTSFVWFQTNNASAFGTPAAYFDLWADTADFNNVQFAFGADNPATFNHRGRTEFYNIQDVLGNTEDSIMTIAGDRIGKYEFEASIQGDSYHLEFLMLNPDSSAYNFRFMTTGTGEYDLWGGTFNGISELVSTNLPTLIEMPDIQHYHLPDSLQSVISGWASSEKIISVGYSRNVQTYDNVNGDPYTHNDVPVGHLSGRSSRGPSRKGVMKPDVVAPGAVVLSAGPLAILTSYSAGAPNAVSLGGMHLRYSGSSMASPVVAGIGALFFEQCPKANYEDFKRNLTGSATEDAITGTTPNYSWGYGRANAFRTLISAEQEGCKDSNYVSIPMNDTDETGIELFPNPTNHLITLIHNGRYESASLHDFNGKLIETVKLNSKENAQFNLQGLESGVYLVRLRNGEETVIRKVIKNK